MLGRLAAQTFDNVAEGKNFRQILEFSKETSSFHKSSRFHGLVGREIIEQHERAEVIGIQSVQS